MNTDLKSQKVRVVLALVSCLAPVAAQASAAAGTPTRTGSTIAKVNDLRLIESAREIIGQNVASRDGTTIGQLRDMAVDPKDGRIIYGLVAAGGVLGFGKDVRAVPFSAFGDEYSPDGNLTIEADRQQWEQARGREPSDSACTDAGHGPDGEKTHERRRRGR